MVVQTGTRFKITATVALRPDRPGLQKDKLAAYVESVREVDDWIAEHQPVISLKVEDSIQGRDVSGLFQSSITFAPGRYGHF